MECGQALSLRLSHHFDEHNRDGLCCRLFRPRPSDSERDAAAHSYDERSHGWRVCRFLSAARSQPVETSIFLRRSSGISPERGSVGYIPFVNTLEGERWGNYVLEERIGAGGMAEVFRARRVGAAAFSKLVCIKRLHAHLSSDPEFVQLFLDEARTGAKLRHRNIVAIDDLGVHEGRYFLAMEYVNGVDLARLEQRMRQAGMVVPADVGVFIAAELLTALDAAHTAVDPDDGHPLRVVHRDVSPHNVLISYAGEVKLTDFGIARAERRCRVTQGAVVRGRFGYMPLEQASGGTLDARADLFALGVTLFELLAGQRPFRGDDPDATLESIIAAQATNDRPSLKSLRPDLPPPLFALVEWLLGIRPDDRPPDAASALEVLQPLRERVTGGAALAALMGQLYPSQASVVCVSRPSVPPAIQPAVTSSTASVEGSSVASLAYAPTVPSSPLLGMGGFEPTVPLSPPWTAAGVPGVHHERAETAIAAPIDSVRGQRSEERTDVTSPAVPGVASTVPRARAVAGDWRFVFFFVAVLVVLAGGVVVLSVRRGSSAGASAGSESRRAVAISPSRIETMPSTPVVPAPGLAGHSLDPAPVVSSQSGHLRTVAPRRETSVSRVSQGLSVSPRLPVVDASVSMERGSVVTTVQQPLPVPTGAIRVIAMPWGDVYIDGRHRGRAPVTVQVPVGEHTVRITGGVEHTERVVVTANGVRLVTAERGME